MSDNPTGEVRVTSSTGGQKGTKPQRPGLIPPDTLLEFSEIYAVGAEKYDDHNWRKGYAWHLSIDAALRHLEAFNAGEDYDTCKCVDRQENGPVYPCSGCGATGKKHVLQAAWHCFTLAWYMNNKPEFDDRAIRFDEKANAEVLKKANPTLETVEYKAVDFTAREPVDDTLPHKVASLDEPWMRNFVWVSQRNGFTYEWRDKPYNSGWHFHCTTGEWLLSSEPVANNGPFTR